MTGILGLLLIVGATADQPPDSCEPEAPVRDPVKCEPFNPGEDFEIYSLESVAVGSTAQMQSVREGTRHCEVPANRIDGVGMVDVAVYDIFNATHESRACVLQWIEQNAPELRFSKERFHGQFDNAPLLDPNADGNAN